MNVVDFKKLTRDEQLLYETPRLGCNDTPMVVIEGHSIGTLHTLCLVCECCHDCDDGSV